MTELATWIRAQMQERGYNQIQTSVHTGIAPGALSEILHKDHVHPRPSSAWPTTLAPTA